MVKRSPFPRSFVNITSSSIFLAFVVAAALGSAEAVSVSLSSHISEPLNTVLLLVYGAAGYGISAAIVVASCAIVLHRSRRSFPSAFGLAIALTTFLAIQFVCRLVQLHQPALVWLVPGCILTAILSGWILYRLLIRIPAVTKERTWIIITLATLFTGGAIGIGKQNTGKTDLAVSHQERPNVLLISVDTLRRDRLGCYGYSRNQTPHIDRLATESALFEDVTAPVALTGPSHTSMLTGLYPVHHSVTANGIRLPSNIVTLPELMSKAGYRTVGFIGGYTLTDMSAGLAGRFDHYDDDLARWPLLPDIVWRLKLGRLIERSWFILTGKSLQDDERSAEMVTTGTLQWLETNYREPFFLFVHFFDPHGPRPLSGPYRGIPIEQERKILSNENNIRSLTDFYDQEVQYADRQIGRLLREVTALGLLDKTLIIFTADHGESFTEHDYYFDHALCLSEVCVRVPLLIRFPDQRWSGERVPAQVRLIDLAPTILDFLSMATPAQLDGKSVLPILKGSEKENRVSFGAIDKRVFREERTRYYVRRDGYKLIWFFDRPESLSDRPTTEQLFDVANDPGETINILASSPPILRELREQMQKWMLLNRGVSSTESPTEEEQERLRSLGYF